MYQTVGHEVVEAVAECLGLPLVRDTIAGTSKNTALAYAPTQGDEVESLYSVLVRVKQMYPQVDAVCSGAILSTYQKNRVVNV